MPRNAIIIISLLACCSCDAFLVPAPSSPVLTALAAQISKEDAVSSRREALSSVLLGALALSPMAASALDMEAFANSQIEADVKKCDPKTDRKCIPKLDADEALCNYGQSGEARGEACKRVKAKRGKLPTSQPQGKSLGGAYAM